LFFCRPDGMDVVILAAGRGTRFGRGLPKCLVRFRGKTLLERQVAALRDACPELEPWRVHVVTGYKHDLVEQHVRKTRLGVSLLFNPSWNSAGILGSAWVSLPHVGPEVLRLDSDLLFSDHSELARLLAAPATSLCLGHSYRPRTTPIACVRNGRVESISLVDNYKGPGEWLCAEFYKEGDYAKVVQSSPDLIIEGHYFKAMNRSILSGPPYPLAFWMSGAYEMDSEEDLSHVRRMLS